MVSRSQAKLIRKLATRKHREAESLFLVEGVRLVEELLAAAWPVEIAVVAPSLEATERGQALLERMRASGWSLVPASDDELERLAPTRSPQGVLVVSRRPEMGLEGYDPPRESSILVFDRVSDPGNLGTLIRTGRALGVDRAVALPGTVDPWNPKAVRASAGSLFHLPLSRETWETLLLWFRRHGFHILCADPKGEPVMRGSAVRDRFALVLGNEPGGLSPSTLRDCDRRIGIPLSDSVESLNVAIAGALLLDRLLASPRGGGAGDDGPATAG